MSVGNEITAKRNMDIVHDENVDDSMYSVGWREVSTCFACEKRDCGCNRSGSCRYYIFNHYMCVYEEEDHLDATADLFYFPLYITNGTADEISVEEVRCRPHTVRAAYSYYMRKVIKDSLSQTMVSVFLGDFKSTCFNILCFFLEMKEGDVPGGSFCVEGESTGMVNVLSRGLEATSSILEAICMLGINPIVDEDDEKLLIVTDPDGIEQTLNVCTSGFSNEDLEDVNFMGRIGSKPRYATTNFRQTGVYAVSTAIVTISIVLTPKSMYGGKNPTTKKVSYHIHNVKIQ